MSLVHSGVHPKAVLHQHGLHPKKSFGQNFLLTKNHLAAIAARVDTFSKGSVVVEFGAGLGALTAELLRLDRKIIAVERDRELVPVLQELFAGEINSGKLRLLEDDAQTTEISHYTTPEGSKPIVCGNLPYHITSQLLRKAIDTYDEMAGAVFLIQSEVGERLIAPPGNKIYGILSVLAQSRFNITKVVDVPRECFWPVPRVDSTVVCFEAKSADQMPRVDWKLFSSVVKSAFAHRRKTLRNCLIKFENIEELLAKQGLHGGLRAEVLSVDNYVKLSQDISHA